MKSTKKNSKFRKNIILGKETCIALDADNAGSNLNSIVIGSASSGTISHTIEPNILQANTSYVISDPGGYLYEKYGPYLQHMGYQIKCLNLMEPDKSDHYNPLAYIHSDRDIEILVEDLMKSTGLCSAENVYTKCEFNLLCAMIGYLHHYGEKESQNFSIVIEMLLDIPQPDEDDYESRSPVDQLFENARELRDGFAVRQYDCFKLGTVSTKRSALVSAAVRLRDFTLDEVKHMTDSDDLHLEKMSDEKTALFLVMPQTDNHLMFLASLLCHQICQMNLGHCRDTAAFTQLDKDGDGEVQCPIQIQFLLSDFARIPYIQDFPFLLSVLNSHGMSVMMGIQSVEQLEQVYGKRWRELVENCDICIYLGSGTTRETFLWLSERLSLSDSRTKKFGSMPRSKCLIHVRGHRPVVVDKYPLTENPNWKIASGLAADSSRS